MPVCCSVMRSLMLPGDVLLETPAKGAGAKIDDRVQAAKAVAWSN
jgi:hypothetical protein